MRDFGYDLESPCFDFKFLIGSPKQNENLNMYDEEMKEEEKVTNYQPAKDLVE